MSQPQPAAPDGAVHEPIGAPSQNPFAEALDDAEELLKYAAEVGKPVPPEVVKNILAAREAAAANGDSQTMRSNFYAAFTQLSSICGDVTARTIRNCSAPETLRSLARNRRWAVLLTLFIAAVSVVTFVTDDLSKKILADIASANADAAKLRIGLSDADGNPAKLDAHFAKDAPCSLIATPPDPRRDPVIRGIDDVNLLQQFTATNRELLGRSLKLNWVILNWECDPFNLQHCRDRAHDEQRPPDDLHQRLQINPSILNFGAEVLCKIQTYQQIRTFATNVQGDYAAIIGALGAFLLPILYAWLGSYAYRLREFGETIRHKTYHPSFANSARMITAVIAGAIVGLFNPSQGISLSPLATAFLVGYGVELFFRFLDTLINFGAPTRQSGPARP